MRIVIIAGPICSGKDTCATQLIADGIVESHISIGDIVRKITSTDARTFNKDLDKQIIEELLNELNRDFNWRRNVVITGIRQLNIVKAVEEFMKEKKGKLHYTWLLVHQHICMKRWEARKDVKDKDLTYTDVHEKDVELGLEHVRDYIFELANFDPYKDCDLTKSTTFVNAKINFNNEQNTLQAL